MCVADAFYSRKGQEKCVDQITGLQILDEVWSYVSPGGMEEVKELTNYIRNPGSSNTAEEARDKMRLWRLATKKSDGHESPRTELSRKYDGVGKVGEGN